MTSVGLADHYGVLEVDREANEIIIKKAYRRLVLLWHPDKHLTNREEAEGKIRQVNDAYETLSNPFKRSQYDQQLLALERKARGFRLDTTGIKPRMSIPKEFMLSPLGHPEKFVRTVGMSVFAQSRADTKIEFHDFFRDAKFSLWWLPEVNNMCRLRPTTTAGVGQDGGMNFNFALHRTVNVSEVVLSPGAMPDSVNVIAVASPVFQGAFRFEAAHFPGHYLAYKPPTHLRMVGGVVDEKTSIDFMLVDYAQMFKYITAEEVLMPAVTGLGGEREHVPLDVLRGDSNVRLYFEQVLKKAVWADEDFETFFASRSSEWDFERKTAMVRLRSKHEQLANSLRRSVNVAEMAAAISSAGAYEVCQLPLDTLEAVLGVLGQAPPHTASVSFVVNILDAQKKILAAIPKACEKDPLSLEKLLAVCEQVAHLGNGRDTEAKVSKWRDDAVRELADVVSDHIRHQKAASHLEMTLPVLTTVCELPLAWGKCSERLAKIAKPLSEEQPLAKLLPLLNAVTKALPGSEPLAELLSQTARKQLKHAEPAVAAATLDLLVSGGLLLDSAAASLERVLPSAPFHLLASVVAGLGERACVEGLDELKNCAAFLGRAPAALEALPPALLLRLTVAATKSVAVAENALDAVAAAAALTLPAWPADDAAKLLLAVAKTKQQIHASAESNSNSNSNGSSSGSKGVAALYDRAAIELPLKLKSFSSVQLIKVLLAVGQVPACRPLVEAAAIEAASNRLQELPSAQLLLLTQGLLSLGGDHVALRKVLDFWAAAFNEASRAEDLLTESMGSEAVRDRRVSLEAKGQLTADQVAKLAQTLASKAPNHSSFWKALADRFVGQGESEGIAGSLTSAGKAALQAAFPHGGGPDFDGKTQMLSAAFGSRTRKHKEKNKERDKDGDRSRDNEKEGGRDHGRESRDREKEGSCMDTCGDAGERRRRSDEPGRSSKINGRARSRSVSGCRKKRKTAPAKDTRTERDDGSGGLHKSHAHGGSRSNGRELRQDASTNQIRSVEEGVCPAPRGAARGGKEAREKERERESEPRKNGGGAGAGGANDPGASTTRRRDGEEKGQSVAVDEEERKRQRQERRLKLKTQDKELEERRKQDEGAEAEKRRLQRERRANRVVVLD